MHRGTLFHVCLTASQEGESKCTNRLLTTHNSGLFFFLHRFLSGTEYKKHFCFGFFSSWCLIPTLQILKVFL